MASIALNNINKHWGATHALSDINLQIDSGSFCVFLGPSGCGKSTTLRIIAGLETASSGSVYIDARDVTHLPPSQRGIAMVFQNYALFPHLTVADNITFGLQVRKLPAAERQRRLQETAALLGLSHLLERRPGQLSGGQQQRVALGRALVAQAKVCLMDEPLSNLDAQLRQDMRRELRELQRQLGLTVIYVTHDQAEAMSMADQVVLLNGGRIEQAASARELYARPASTFAARFIGTPPMNLLALEQGRIAGSDVLTTLPATATHLGVRPEAVTAHPAGTPGTVAASITNTEYLGADLVLACAVGSQNLLVRADGRLPAEPGATVGLAWAPEDAHAFDERGLRL
ncbi:ABC transporter ATP-binding protein [Vandammella animalimorsus]|uniref:ABC transporter ATP-binding protein n=1 Tax=Vandammella animalimorsus TaxID=2029117 RepID=UPI00325A84B2